MFFLSFPVRPHPLYLQGLWHFFNLSTVKDEIITFADRQRNQILLKFLLITGFCKKGHRCSCADAPKYQSAVLPSVIIDREFDTLKSKKVPQSLEIGLFFCQIFIFII